MAVLIEAARDRNGAKRGGTEVTGSPEASSVHDLRSGPHAADVSVVSGRILENSC